MAAVDNKDSYTRHHSDEVTVYALAMADALGLSESSQRVVRVAGMLHDVGKIGIPDRILRKPASLTPAEYEIVKGHSALGEALIAAMPDLEEIRPPSSRITSATTAQAILTAWPTSRSPCSVASWPWPTPIGHDDGSSVPQAARPRKGHRRAPRGLGVPVRSRDRRCVPRMPWRSGREPGSGGCGLRTTLLTSRLCPTTCNPDADRGQLRRSARRLFRRVWIIHGGPTSEGQPDDEKQLAGDWHEH